MNHFILNLSDGDQEQADSHLQSKRWPLVRGERHCSALAPGDLALVHVGKPQCRFIGRVSLATALQDWPLPENEAHGDSHSGGVLLADVDRWPRAVPLAAVIREIDPTGSNPLVQANASGFRSGVVMITAGEYTAAVRLGSAG